MRNHLIEFREERDLGQKINATFGFLRQNLKPLLRLMLVFVVPFALLAGIFSGIYQSRQLAEVTGAVRHDSLGAWSFANSINSLHYWVSIFFSLVGVVLLMLTVYSYMIRYQDQDGQVETQEVWDDIKTHFISLLYSSIGLLVLVLLATLLLVLPGIYVSVALSMYALVMLREEVNLMEAVERCFHLIKGNWWASFGFLMLVLIIQGVIGFVASLPAIVVYVFRILHLPFPGGDSDLLLIIASSFTTVLSLLLYVIYITAIAFLYYDLVEKKEGLGYLEKVNQIGARPEAVAGAEYH
ncbi:hypothetical protein TH63_15540 [Rufibacter radiotolerans]|uniref:Glycerophosphoryl diester phosphodiesterase membrane domain-containing protein n=1 Tax=Rufibacter radiotolerans TaxID=1379910 RepID=A0A0H4VSF5_9BACT|nr:hypothetical protein [Rufibacter radiotolerans]AKQ46714.1 hypothetical protein TH63_15540 [Rufibacter radiotolerans]